MLRRLIPRGKLRHVNADLLHYMKGRTNAPSVRKKCPLKAEPQVAMRATVLYNDVPST